MTNLPDIQKRARIELRQQKAVHDLERIGRTLEIEQLEDLFDTTIRDAVKIALEETLIEEVKYGQNCGEECDDDRCMDLLDSNADGWNSARAQQKANNDKFMELTEE